MRPPVQPGRRRAGGDPARHGGARLASILRVPVAVPLGSPVGDLSMAEIRVEPRRRSRIWIWLLLAAIVAGLVYYFFYYQPG
jgi:drug/metabolite transporter (DMT)-like permease